MVLEESNLDMSNRADHRPLGTATRILMTEEKEFTNILPIPPKPIEMEKKIVPEHPYCTNWPINRPESLKQREQREGYAEAKAAEDKLRDIRGGQ